jgi:hypothetical protein
MVKFRPTLVLLALGAVLSGCYVVPVRGPDGTVVYDHYPLPPVGTPLPVPPAAAAGQMPAVLTSIRRTIRPRRQASSLAR